MIFIDQMKNLKIYKQQIFMPTLTDNKKTGSVSFLLTPNYESSKKIMNHPMLINRLRYQSYYLEKDVSYYINDKVLKDKTLNESYIRESTASEISKIMHENAEIEIGKTAALIPFLRFSGYESDVLVAKTIMNTDTYFCILTEILMQDINAVTDIPVLHFTISTTEEYSYSFYRDANNVKYINYEIPILSLNEDREEYILKLLSIVCASIMYLTYTKSENTVLPLLYSDYIATAESKYGDIGRVLFEKIDFDPQYKSILSTGNVEEVVNLVHDDIPWLKVSDLTIEDSSIFETRSAPITMENLNTRFKYLTTTKLKRQYSTRMNGIKNLIKDINSRLETIKSSIHSPNIGFGSSSTGSTQESGDGYMKFGNIITFFDEATNAYNNQYRKMFYDERLKQRSDIIAIYDSVKLDNPFIKYTYPDLDKYKAKNLFDDLRFYNELYFKNNTWNNRKSYSMYIELLRRLINDPRIKKAGYTKKTIFIPVADWNKSRDTKMWLYTNGVNPISIIYELMRTDSPILKEVFGDMDLIFLSQDVVFKLNFAQLEDPKKSLATFKTFIVRILANQEFEPEDVDTTYDGGNESKEVIQANIIDKIEASKGVDLTGKATKVKAKDKQLDKVVNKDVPKSKPREYINSTSSSIATIKTTPEEVKDKEVKEIPLTKTADTDSIKNKEADLEKLAVSIDNISDDSKNTDDALEKMDTDQIKAMLIDIQSSSTDTVKIDPARAARMNELDKEFLATNVKGKSVKEILDEKENPDLDKTVLKIDSPNEEWKNMTYMNFDKDYDLNKDIIACFYHFTKVSKPVAIRSLKSEDNSTSEDRLDLYTVEMEDFNGKRFTIKVDIPKQKDNRYLLRGNNKSIQTQLFNMPIVKTDLDTCQIISNYQKIFIRRYNTSTGRSLPITSRFIKAITKYDGKDIKISYGNDSRICDKYQLPMDYIDIAGVVDRIETDNAIIYFNQDDIRKDYPNVDDSLGVPYGIDKKTKEIYYYKATDPAMTFTLEMMYKISTDKFKELFDAQKASTSGTYSMCSILSTTIPLVVVTAYAEGLTNVLDKAHIEYVLMNYKDPKYKDYNNDRYEKIKFNDGYLFYIAGYVSCLLMNGFKDIDTEDYSITDINSKNMYLEALDNFGGRIKADGLDNFYDCLIDPITKENLDYYHLPTDYVSVLLYANVLLADNKFVKHTSTESRRARRGELIAAYTYEALSEAYASYANQIRHGRTGVAMTMKQSVVIDKFMSSPVSSDDSIINALNAVETTNAITYKGKAGLNNDRSYSLDKRTYDDSMLNVVGASTGFSANVGITRQATMDMNVESSRGYIKTINSDTSKFNAAKTLCATEGMTPFGTTRDDAMRTEMTFIQTAKHMVRTESSDPLLVTNGTDQAIPYLTTDKFAFKAKKDGKVLSVDDKMMLIEYKDGTKDYINLAETVEKNSDGGYYEPLQLTAIDKLKEGSKITANQILAYDKRSFSNSLGESDNLSYDIGKLAKVAVINTDDGFEDSGVCTEKLSKELTTRIVTESDCTIDKDSSVFKMVKIGDEVEVNQSLIVWENPHDEEEADSLINYLANSKDEVSELGRKTLGSEVTGKVVDIKIYRTVELSELSESLRKIVESYERPIKQLKKTLEDNGIEAKDLPATYKLELNGKLKKAQDAVRFEFYVEYSDIVAVGDKITYFAANKATIKNVLPNDLAPYTDFRPKEKIDAFLSTISVDKRMVSSVLIYGSIQKLLIETDRSIKDILGIPYDETGV